MERRDFLKKAAISAGLISTTSILSSCISGLKTRDKIEPPNLLFLFADDQCHAALHAFGSDVETPNLDRLVNQGTSFTNTYNQGAWNGAVCIASRKMLNTGRFLWNAFSTNIKKEKSRGHLWSQYFNNKGYHTYMAGKWHVHGVSPSEIFDTTGHVRPGMPNQTKEGYHRPKSKQDYEEGWKPWEEEYGGYWKGGTHWSEVLGNEGIDFLQTATNKENPFFMYLAFNAPHDPRQSPKKYVDKYPLDDVDVPDNYLPEYPYKDAIGCSENLRDEALAPFPRTKYSVKVNRQEYYAIITHMDHQIGRILDALEKSGEMNNTYIFFTADHGLSVGHHGLMGKQNMFEHSMKAPLIINGPSIPKDKQISTPVYLQDIMPTTLELAGIQIPEQVEFKSLLPLLNNQKRKQYDYIYGAYKGLQRMIRKDNFKLIYYPEIDETLLFDLAKDPQEICDLSDKEKYQPIKAKLLNLLEKADQKMGLKKKKVKNLAKGKPIELIGNPTIKYANNGIKNLNDGIVGTDSIFDDGNWLGVQTDDLEIIIDMEQIKNLSNLKIGLMENHNSWIFLPEYVDIFLSRDRNFSDRKRIETGDNKKSEIAARRVLTYNVNNKKVRYIKVFFKNIGECPDWHKAAGKKAWFFCDEVIVE